MMAMIRKSIQEVYHEYKNRVHYGVAFLFAALLVMPAGQALATEVSKGVQVGLLECHTVEGSGFSLLVHSTSDVTCRFEAAGGGVSATVGIGAGVQTLVGGGNRSISLQLQSPVVKERVFPVVRPTSIWKQTGKLFHYRKIGVANGLPFLSL